MSSQWQQALPVIIGVIIDCVSPPNGGSRTETIQLSSAQLKFSRTLCSSSVASHMLVQQRSEGKKAGVYSMGEVHGQIREYRGSFGSSPGLVVPSL